MNGLLLGGFMYVMPLHILHKTNDLCDSHGILSDIFFGPQLNIEYVLGFFR
jgi:hypothetical protein